MGNNWRCAAMAFALAATIGTGSCRSWPWGDPVSGHWEGNWYLANATKPGGALRCDVTRAARNQWKAVFEAEFGQTASYKVELLGERVGDVVVFGGEVNLGGASGGVFKWKGQADGRKFTGEYNASAYGGKFDMNRVSAKSKPAEKKPVAAPSPTPAAK